MACLHRHAMRDAPSTCHLTPPWCKLEFCSVLLHTARPPRPTHPTAAPHTKQDALSHSRAAAPHTEQLSLCRTAEPPVAAQFRCACAEAQRRSPRRQLEGSVPPPAPPRAAAVLLPTSSLPAPPRSRRAACHHTCFSRARAATAWQPRDLHGTHLGRNTGNL